MISRTGETIKLRVLEPQTIGDNYGRVRINIAPFVLGPTSIRLLSAYFLVELTDAMFTLNWPIHGSSPVADQIFWEMFVRDTRGSMDEKGRGTESIFLGHTRPRQLDTGQWICVCDTNDSDSGMALHPPIPMPDTELDVEVVLYYAHINRTVPPDKQTYVVRNRKYFTNGMLLNFELRREDNSYSYTRNKL